MTMRTGTVALWIGGFVLFGLCAVLTFQRGGYQADDQLRALAVGCLVLAGLAVAAPWPLWRSRSGAVGCLALAGLAGWTWLSVGWAPIEINAHDDGWRVTLYAVAFAAALIVMRAPLVRRATPWALLAIVLAASVYGLGTRLVPDAFPAEVFRTAGARLAHPITYWNGLGLFAAAGALLGVACAAERGAAPRWARSLACAAAVPCAFASYLTLSRGAFLAALAGLVVLGLFRPRPLTAVAAACALLPAGALIGAVQGFDRVRAVPTQPPEQSSQGLLLAGLVVLGAVVAGIVFALMAPGLDRSPKAWRPRFRLAAALGVGAVLLVLVTTVAVSYAAEQSEGISGSTERVTEAKTFRRPYWEVALGSFADEPLRGTGSGSFRVEWRRENIVPSGAFDAHSLYFETLAELGAVGGLLLATFLGALLVGLLRRARAAIRDPVLPAAAAVLGAYAVHLGVDWDWELAGLMVPALLLSAAAVTPPEPDLEARRAAAEAP